MTISNFLIGSITNIIVPMFKQSFLGILVYQDLLSTIYPGDRERSGVIGRDCEESIGGDRREVGANREGSM